MKYALINNNRVEAAKGSKGACPNCGAELIAKCGAIKVHHWAHIGKHNCDLWWEPETKWHRSWKECFPSEWQEFPKFDEQTGEKHIADIYTSDGFVIEFQHSNINPDERIAREIFYKNMVWIIDGTRLKNDYSRFLNGKTNFRVTDNPRIYYVSFVDECFPSAWVGSSTPVIFDFKGNDIIDDPTDIRNHLYCLLPKKDDKPSILITLSRRDFIDTTNAGKLSSIFMSFFDRPNQYEQLKQSQDNQTFKVRRQSPFIVDRGRFIKRRRF